MAVICGVLSAEKYVTRKDRIAENVRNEFKRREEERYHEQELGTACWRV